MDSKMDSKTNRQIDVPDFPYTPNVIEFADRTITLPGASESCSFKEAAASSTGLEWALTYFFPDKNPTEQRPPLEFTQYVLRHWAINQPNCRRFLQSLKSEIRTTFTELIRKLTKNLPVLTVPVHDPNNLYPSSFRSHFAKYFFRKTIHNQLDISGRFVLCEKFASIFPFRVRDEFHDKLYVEILFTFDPNFYFRIQNFLNEHFENEDASRVVSLFLTNIRHFQATHEGDLLTVYLSTFRRLSLPGSLWLQKLCAQYCCVRLEFDEVEDFTEYSFEEARELPESNFADLYKLLSVQYYRSNFLKYCKLFKKYVFFFVHALKARPNPIHFIDNALFECLKCLHSVKTSRQDFSIVSDIAKLALVHSRTERTIGNYDDPTNCRIEMRVLENIKQFAHYLPNIETVQIDAEYRTDYLRGEMLLRVLGVCCMMRYSDRTQTVDDFYERLLCCILPPDTYEEKIIDIVIYNALKGDESHWSMPANKETIRNFVRFSNTHDFNQETEDELREQFLIEDLDLYFTRTKYF